MVIEEQFCNARKKGLFSGIRIRKRGVAGKLPKQAAGTWAGAATNLFAGGKWLLVYPLFIF